MQNFVKSFSKYIYYCGMSIKQVTSCDHLCQSTIIFFCLYLEVENMKMHLARNQKAQNSLCPEDSHWSLIPTMLNKQLITHNFTCSKTHFLSIQGFPRFTFVQESQGGVERSFSLPEEEQLTIYSQNFNVFMTAIVKQTTINNI